MTATLTRSAQPTAPPLTRRGGRARETVIFWIAIALIALHVIDDNYLQPQPGTAPGDHLVSGLVPLALLGLAAWTYPRLRGGRRAPNSKHGEHLNDGYDRAAMGPSTNWAIPESKHVGGIEARPEEYERRVVGFFDAALAR